MIRTYPRHSVASIKDSVRPGTELSDACISVGGSDYSFGKRADCWGGEPEPPEPGLDRSA